MWLAGRRVGGVGEGGRVGFLNNSLYAVFGETEMGVRVDLEPCAPLLVFILILVR